MDLGAIDVNAMDIGATDAGAALDVGAALGDIGALEIDSSAVRTASMAVLGNPSFWDMGGDLFAGLVPGLTYAIATATAGTYTSEFRRMMSAMAPLTVMFVWYFVRVVFFKRQHKIGNLKLLLLGYAISLAVMIGVGVPKTVLQKDADQP